MDTNDKEKDKKQILLRLSSTLWQELASWAQDDFRSINGQIEYLLSECVRRRKKILPRRTVRMTVPSNPLF
jgi:hypothetical protein